MLKDFLLFKRERDREIERERERQRQRQRETEIDAKLSNGKTRRKKYVLTEHQNVTMITAMVE